MKRRRSKIITKNHNFEKFKNEKTSQKQFVLKKKKGKKRNEKRKRVEDGKTKLIKKRLRQVL